MPYQQDDPRRRIKPWHDPVMSLQPKKKPPGHRESQTTTKLATVALKALDDLRLALSVQLLCSDTALSRSGLILLLVDLFKAGKIDIDDIWARKQLMTYPRRGRPRKPFEMTPEFRRSLQNDGDRKKQPW